MPSKGFLNIEVMDPPILAVERLFLQLTTGRIGDYADNNITFTDWPEKSLHQYLPGSSVLFLRAGVHSVITFFTVCTSNKMVPRWIANTLSSKRSVEFESEDTGYRVSAHSPLLGTYTLHTNSGCGKERRILIGPW